MGERGGPAEEWAVVGCIVELSKSEGFASCGVKQCLCKLNNVRFYNASNGAVAIVIPNKQGSTN